MQEDFDRNYPSSEIDILGINEEGQESSNDVITADSDLPWLQDVDANQNNISDVWYDQWQVTYRDVWVVDEDNEFAGVFNLTGNDLANPVNYNALRQMVVDVATANRVAASPWQNRVEPMDVTNDGFVVPNDVLNIINRINDQGAGQLPTSPGPVPSFVDVSGDNFVSSIDALRVIRHLNSFSITAEGEPSDGANLDVVAATDLPREGESVISDSAGAVSDSSPVMVAEAIPKKVVQATITPAADHVDSLFALESADDPPQDELALVL